MQLLSFGLNVFKTPSPVGKSLILSCCSYSSKAMKVSFDSSQPLHFCDGVRSQPTQPTHSFDVLDPSTGNVLVSCPASSKNDVDSAVKVAKNAFPAWSRLSCLERGKILTRAAQLIRDNLKDIAKIESLDNGKPVYESEWDVEGCADIWSFYAGIAPTIKGDHIPLSNGNFAYTRREPLGVVAGIGAWNYPFQTFSWKLAPALACGNTFVYKPSPFAPVTPVWLAEILTEAGVPKGVVNVIQGERETGESLCQHPDVAKVSFTGSVPTGQNIMRMCGTDGLKQVTLELGGKSPLIIFDDANLDNAAKGAMLANFLTQGEVCSNAARVFVHESVLKEFTEKVVERTKQMKIGDPQLRDTTVGATITEDHMHKVLGYIQSAKDEGAKLEIGGTRVIPDDPKLKNGFFLSPCIFSGVTDNMRVAKEEVFGSVMCIMPFKDEDEVVRRANDTHFGLSAGVFTENLQKAHRVIAQLQAGACFINTYNVVAAEVPFGGYKMSGFGRECGEAALNQYSQIKSVIVELGDLESPI